MPLNFSHFLIIQIWSNMSTLLLITILTLWNRSLNRLTLHYNLLSLVNLFLQQITFPSFVLITSFCLLVLQLSNVSLVLSSLSMRLGLVVTFSLLVLAHVLLLVFLSLSIVITSPCLIFSRNMLLSKPKSFALNDSTFQSLVLSFSFHSCSQISSLAYNHSEDSIQGSQSHSCIS